MPTPAETWQLGQRQVTDAVARQVLRAWDAVRLADPQRTFAAALPEMLAAVTAGQMAVAVRAPEYVAAAIRADGATPDPVAVVPPQRFAGVTSDGRDLVGLLAQPLVRSLYARARGADEATALERGRMSLETLTRTELLDTGRDAVGVAAGLDRSVIGYVRQVRLPACGRCVLLADKWFKRNEGFLRHPRCDCQHVPSARRQEGATPRELFDRMTREQQDAAFGTDAAEVIRRGGDIGRVVNARRGMASAGDNWTTERARGQRRPSPGFLLRQAGDDPDLFALALERAGYL